MHIYIHSKYCNRFQYPESLILLDFDEKIFMILFCELGKKCKSSSCNSGLHGLGRWYFIPPAFCYNRLYVTSIRTS